jgi:myo-inositol 2-dehydrogenase / D-chiro-inositol 1-dehydrogenase
MSDHTPAEHPAAPGSSRRDFLRQTGAAVAGTALAGLLARGAYAAAGDDTISVALVGCGGRGGGAAANALSTTSGPTKLIAVADVFADRAAGTVANLAGAFADKVDVPPERQFAGFDAYRRAIDALPDDGVVLLATPPTFRPLHVEYAVNAGRHVFMEKSFGVDAPGVRRILRAGEVAAEKDLKIAGGLMSRHYAPLEAAAEQIHNGLIGEVITCWAYRVHEPVGYKPRAEGMSELMHQINNYSNFTWLNGTFILDWLIHNLDVCCWVKGGWPVSAEGQGGRQVRTEPDQLFDHIAVEYTFEDGTRLLAQGRNMASCWGFFGDVIHGATGCAVLGEGQPEPRILEGHRRDGDKVIWRYDGDHNNPYQTEHELLFSAIREGTPYNEAERCAHAAMTGILGRMAAESGQLVTWEEAMASELELAPDLAEMTYDSEPPVLPDSDGRYPVAMPGITVAF